MPEVKDEVPAAIEIIPGQPRIRHTAEQVLVVGADDWAIDDASSQLTAAGRTVHRCCDSSEHPFPCNALIPDRGCPLDEHSVDAVLMVRSRPSSEPTISAMGAICGLRDGVPLVVGGISDASPFAPWATRVPPSGDIVATCDEAVRSHG
ncbi:MAG: hypothetical protein JO337_10080 [Acidimicrobiales bacterium]|nr:hypothetical protein [Acidimicrobiales bacterium]